MWSSALLVLFYLVLYTYALAMILERVSVKLNRTGTDFFVESGTESAAFIVTWSWIIGTCSLILLWRHIGCGRMLSFALALGSMVCVHWSSRALILWKLRNEFIKEALGMWHDWHDSRGDDHGVAIWVRTKVLDSKLELCGNYIGLFLDELNVTGQPTNVMCQTVQRSYPGARWDRDEKRFFVPLFDESRLCEGMKLLQQSLKAQIAVNSSIQIEYQGVRMTL